MQLVAAKSVSEFFREVVVAALRSQSVKASELVEFYLVNLLTEFTKGVIDDEPLGIKLAHAMQEAPGERASHLREVGDTSLYVSGFFGESIERRQLAVSYYIAMGGSAYAALASLLRMNRGSEELGGMYGELSDKFSRFVDVLTEVADKASLGSNRGLLRLYERWLRTRSKWLADELIRRGLIPPGEGTVQ